MIEPVFHKNLVVCGHGSMMYDELNKINFISFHITKNTVALDGIES
jgi:hypothetical protein